jgi:hypothetical protein
MCRATLWANFSHTHQVTLRPRYFFQLRPSYVYVRSEQGDQMGFWIFCTKHLPNKFLSKLLHNFCHGKSCPNILDVSFFYQKTAQSKKSPKGRKIAQSGHPGSEFLKLGSITQCLPLFSCGCHQRIVLQKRNLETFFLPTKRGRRFCSNDFWQMF